MLSVYGTLHLVGGGGLTVDGRGVVGTNYNYIAIVRSGGKLTMGSGVTLTGGRADGGAGVWNDGMFTMNGGTITGNTVSELGGGVYNRGVFTM
ncbi:MAG: hypothetical protein GX592_01695 [Clostridiales bacterium]|nr:hypothetical protein [Clostridiales bacterium]